MSGVTLPQLLLEAIAAAASAGTAPGDKTYPMPADPTGTNAASIAGGFPTVTMENEASGGEPPLGQDMNGYLFLLSGHTLFVEAGQLYPFSTDVATAIGGYRLGAIIGMADGTGAWLNITDGNTSNPDTGGAGWVPNVAYGVTIVPGLTGGAVNLTSAQTKYTVIRLQGALASNLSVNFPQTNQQWLLANECTGAFTVTAKTAAAGSQGVNIPGGGLGSPTGVYSVGDGNIYPTVSPLGAPIDQNPNPLTIVERTNTGMVLATLFYGTSSFEDPVAQPFNGFIGLGPDQATFRKYRPNDVFNNVVLYGAPSLAADPPANDSGARIADTNFANPGNNVGVTSNGYFTLPGGKLTIQYGSPVPSGTSITLGSTAGTKAGTIVAIAALPIAGGAVQCWMPTNPVGGSSFTLNMSGGTAGWILLSRN